MDYYLARRRDEGAALGYSRTGTGERMGMWLGVGGITLNAASILIGFPHKWDTKMHLNGSDTGLEVT